MSTTGWDAEQHAEWIRKQENRTGRVLREGLCCACGHHFSKWRSPKFSEGVVRESDKVSAFERDTFVASCASCGKRTKHAELRHDKFRSYSEDLEQVVLHGKPIPDYMSDPVPSYLLCEQEEYDRGNAVRWYHSMAERDRSSGRGIEADR
jgi:hypothetical protein